MAFEEFKSRIVEILKNNGLDDSTIEEIINDDEIIFAINNHYTVESVAWAILY